MENAKDLFNITIGCAYVSKDRWIGLRNRHRNERKEEWRNRKGIEQHYQLNILPCIGLFFTITYWEPIEVKKKKK